MLLKVKVWPNSKKEEVMQMVEDSFEIKVKEKPIQGQANERARELLAEYLKIPVGKVWIIKGARQKNKIFEIKCDLSNQTGG